MIFSSTTEITYFTTLPLFISEMTNLLLDNTWSQQQEATIRAKTRSQRQKAIIRPKTERENKRQHSSNLIKIETVARQTNQNHLSTKKTESINHSCSDHSE